MKRFLILPLCVLLMPNVTSISLKDLAASTKDTATGIMLKAPDIIPNPDDFFQLSKNMIAGYPFDVAFKLVNAFCTAALSKKSVKPRILPDTNDMKFVLKTKHKDYTFQLTKPNEMWIHEQFNRTAPLVIFVTGWTTNFNQSNSALEIVFDAYKCRGNVNFIAVDTAKYVDTLYSWSSFNTEELGRLIADGVEQLITTYPIENIHLIGHSLGAHIVGSIGRNLFFKTGKLVPRITGLDPANPCFNEGHSLTGLGRGDAVFVDVIHSNPGALGKRDTMGDVDFYPNGLDPLPPGCMTIVCAHARSWEYYAETVYPGNEKNFMGVRCGSLTALNSNFCPGQKYPMGYAVPNNLKGNYFLKINSKSPFGEFGVKDTNPNCV